MRNIFALVNLAPILMTALSVLAISGAVAVYLLVKLPNRTATKALKIGLGTTVLVPALAYVANNYWIAIHNSAERLAVHAIPMNHSHLQALYFIWWCIMSAAAWLLFVWHKRHAA